jgi:2,3-bisphosphoglycerate-dependent phosphoglycerate mutase
MKTTVIFIRHCESTGQAPDAPLTARGFAEAQALVSKLDNIPIDAVYSSPFSRAVQTVAPLATARGLRIREEPGLRERVLSLSPRADWLTHVERSFKDIDYRIDGGESLREARTRGLQALQRISGDGAITAALASHGNLLSSLLAFMNPGFGFADWKAMTNPALYRVELDGGVPVAFEAI